MFFSPNNIIFFERFLLYSILFISFSQIHDFFLLLCIRSLNCVRNVYVGRQKNNLSAPPHPTLIKEASLSVLDKADESSDEYTSS